MPPDVPDGYQTLTAEGVTVAWDPSVKIEPTTVAFLSAGLLAQIGIVTGTQPRTDLMVIVYPSLDDFRAKSGAPAWSDGIYDGAVRLPAGSRDFGVTLHTLRHELVHAQIHATIGCMPVWLDEGLAQYFANTAPFAEWLGMLGGKQTLPVSHMHAPSVEDVAAEPPLVYAQSLAMLLYALGHGDTIADVIHDRRGPALEVWSRRYPDGNDRAVLDAVARRMFGMPTGAPLDAVLAGEVCCRNRGVVFDISCHPGPRRLGDTCYGGH